MKVFSSPMVDCRRYFLTTRRRKWVLFVGPNHSQRTCWLTTGFTIQLTRRVALTTLANR